MRIVDHTPDVRELVVSAQAALNRSLLWFPDHRPDVFACFADGSRDLLALLTEFYQLRRFARLGAPHIDDLGGFGTGLDDSDAPTIMSMVDGKESWDFQPWLAEKLQAAEQHIFRVCDICLSDSGASYPAWRRLYRSDDPGARCRHLLQGVGEYLTAIVSLLDSGGLKIQQLIKADESDEDGEGDEHL